MERQYAWLLVGHVKSSYIALKENLVIFILYLHLHLNGEQLLLTNKTKEPEFSYACVVSGTGQGVNVVFLSSAQEFPPGYILPVLCLSNPTSSCFSSQTSSQPGQLHLPDLEQEAI